MIFVISQYVNSEYFRAKAKKNSCCKVILYCNVV